MTSTPHDQEAKKKASHNERPKFREETPTMGYRNAPTPRASLSPIFRLITYKIKGKIIFIL